MEGVTVSEGAASMMILSNSLPVSFSAIAATLSVLIGLFVSDTIDTSVFCLAEISTQSSVVRFNSVRGICLRNKISCEEKPQQFPDLRQNRRKQEGALADSFGKKEARQCVSCLIAADFVILAEPAVSSQPVPQGRGSFPAGGEPQGFLVNLAAVPAVF